MAGQAKRTTAPGRPGRRRGRGRGRGRGRRRVYARRGKRFFGAERVFRGIRRFVRGGVRVVPRVLLLRRRVSRRGDCCADFEQPGMCVDQKASSQDLGESGGSSGAADELDGPRPSPGLVRSDGFERLPADRFLIRSRRRYRKPRSRGRQPHRQPHPGPRRGATTDALRSSFRLRPRPNHRPLTPPRRRGRDRTLATTPTTTFPSKKAAFPSPPSSIREVRGTATCAPQRLGTLRARPRRSRRPPACRRSRSACIRSCRRCRGALRFATLARRRRRCRAGTGAGPRWSPPREAVGADRRSGADPDRGLRVYLGAGDAVKAWAEHRAESATSGGGGSKYVGRTSGTDSHEKNKVGPLRAERGAAERYARRAASVDSVDESEIRAR